MQKINKLNYFKFFFQFLVIIIIFFIDRYTKLYLLNIVENGTNVDFYIFSFLNINLVWNTGIGFGLLSFNASLIYNIITSIIISINIFIIYLIIKTKNLSKYFLLIIIGGSLGNLFDRIYYSAVPDFLDFHIGNFHWFIFNIADIFITIGVICLILYEIFMNNKTKKRKENND